MTLPEGRTPLQWDQLSYPSDALTEAKQQRARAEQLEQAVELACKMLEAGAGPTAHKILVDALRASQTGGSGSQ